MKLTVEVNDRTTPPTPEEIKGLEIIRKALLQKEKKPKRRYIDPRAFKMCVPARRVPPSEAPCGTVACIGGHLGLLFGLDYPQATLYVALRGKAVFYDLFWSHTNPKITREQAAQAIKNALDGRTDDRLGSAKWDEVIPNYYSLGW